MNLYLVMEKNTSLTIEVTGGVPPYIIDYNGLDPNNISSGFYSFSVTDDLGCLETFNVFYFRS